MTVVTRKGQVQPPSHFSYFRTLQVFTLKKCLQNKREGQGGKEEKWFTLQNSWEATPAGAMVKAA